MQRRTESAHTKYCHIGRFEVGVRSRMGLGMGVFEEEVTHVELGSEPASTGAK